MAIETALTLRLVFHLPLRQAEGFLGSILSLMGIDLTAPDHTTLSRRSHSLGVEPEGTGTKGPRHLTVDSSGLSIVGEVLLVSGERWSLGLLRRTRGGLGWNWPVLSPSAERARSLVSGSAVNLPVRGRSHSNGNATRASLSSCC